MPCEDKTLAEDLMEQLQYELTNSSYQSPESVRLHKTSNSLAMFIITRNEVGTMLCFYTCLWFCSGAGIQEYIAGGIPTCLAAGLHGRGGNWVSKHALQVFRGVSRPTLRGVAKPGLQAHTQGGFQAHTRGGGILACSEAYPVWMATAMGGTHPTGMHSCFLEGFSAYHSIGATAPCRKSTYLWLFRKEFHKDCLREKK